MVLGVSPDDEKSHQKFVAKHSLPFPLLVDTDHALAEKYGAWGEKNMYGRKMIIVNPIGPDGTLVRAWPKVKVAGHVDQVKQALLEAQA